MTSLPFGATAVKRQSGLTHHPLSFQHIHTHSIFHRFLRQQWTVQDFLYRLAFQLR